CAAVHQRILSAFSIARWGVVSDVEDAVIKNFKGGRDHRFCRLSFHRQKEDGMHDDIWLEVSNVKIKGDDYEVQLRADREPERPRWWPVPTVNTAAEFKTLIDALDKKRPVLAQLVPDGTK